MARRKTLPESVRAKFELAERLTALRLELFGDRGGPELARRLALPVRTWYNYEDGVTIPAEVVLKIIELTAVEPIWLLHGHGPKFRNRGTLGPIAPPGEGATRSVGALLRTALDLLEQQQDAAHPEGVPRPPGLHRRFNAPALSRSEAEPQAQPSSGVVLIRVDDPRGAASPEEGGPHYVPAQAEWLDAERDCRGVRNEGKAMEPIIAEGASVVYSKARETIHALDGKLVVAWIADQPIVRWLEHHGRFALLRAENPATEPAQHLVELDDHAEEARIRRVLWISTPH